MTGKRVYRSTPPINLGACTDIELANFITNHPKHNGLFFVDMSIPRVDYDGWLRDAIMYEVDHFQGAVIYPTHTNDHILRFSLSADVVSEQTATCTLRGIATDVIRFHMLCDMLKQVYVDFTNARTDGVEIPPRSNYEVSPIWESISIPYKELFKYTNKSEYIQLKRNRCPDHVALWSGVEPAPYVKNNTIHVPCGKSRHIRSSAFVKQADWVYGKVCIMLYIVQSIVTTSVYRRKTYTYLRSLATGSWEQVTDNDPRMRKFVEAATVLGALRKC